MSGSVHDSHWLRMDDDRRIVGCQCGFAADESDEGYGDSVVKHIANEALIDAADALPVETEGPSRLGTARWPASYRDVYSLAIEEAQAAIRARATYPPPGPQHVAAGSAPTSAKSGASTADRTSHQLHRKAI